jgi:hypothetical protein
MTRPETHQNLIHIAKNNITQPGNTNGMTTPPRRPAQADDQTEFGTFRDTNEWSVVSYQWSEEQAAD